MWEYNTLEMLQDFVCEPLSLNTVGMFMEHFELNMYELPLCLRNASNLALVHGDADYAFTSDDLMWLSCIDNVALCRGEERNLFFINLSVKPEEYYITSAAAINIFNIVFPGNNQYIFKVGDALASGCKRDFFSNRPNNFCITQLFGFNELKEYVDFFQEALLTDEDALPYLVMQYSPHERLPEKVSHKQREASLDYMLFLRELNDVHGVDTTKEYIRYTESFAQAKSKNATYSDVCASLHFVTEAKDTSSYDVLEDALEQMANASDDNQTNIAYEPQNLDGGNDAEDFGTDIDLDIYDDPLLMVQWFERGQKAYSAPKDLEAERREQERLERERLEAERREQERLERERLEAERREQERLERERLEAERREQERLERERLEAECREQERLERERLEAERRERERLERERLEAERREQERLERERLERERLEAERLEQERLERERLEAERREQERLERERLEAERREQERLEREVQEAKRAKLEAYAREHEQMLVQIQQRYQLEMDEWTLRKQGLEDRIAQIDEKMSTLLFFRFVEKKNLKAEREALLVDLSVLEQQCVEIKERSDKLVSEENERYKVLVNS